MAEGWKEEGERVLSPPTRVPPTAIRDQDPSSKARQPDTTMFARNRPGGRVWERLRLTACTLASESTVSGAPS